ncbi:MULTISPECIES: hypothetical protein [unclassified Massilia]|uniref:hypothetical protein n=1 Tax=unclassified Massilia TaxID=2609279 RepID=UPI001B83AD48|nr:MULTISPECIES: hypothetical protein [unclassified Massilia]MBQ5939014.1 hypothetical protein [Massilia sp. AB1]MBQ5962435.1 hypothetical protein [Massilia sp. ZL223]
MNKSIDQKEWEILYHALRAVCARHGKEDPFGNSDYWVVDDCWGGVTQKIVVTSPCFLTPELVDEISNCVRDTGLWGAQVVVSLDFNLPGEKLPPMGLIVDAQGVIEQWDLDSIRKRVGGDFYRRPGQILRFKPK